jgi:hypothetical protein
VSETDAVNCSSQSQLKDGVTAVSIEGKVEENDFCKSVEGNKEKQVEPTRREASLSRLSKSLKNKLTNAEEENERLQRQLECRSSKILKNKLHNAEEENESLQMQLDAALKQLANVSAASEIQGSRRLELPQLKLCSLSAFSTRSDSKSSMCSFGSLSLSSASSQEDCCDVRSARLASGSSWPVLPSSTFCDGTDASAETHCDTAASLQQACPAVDVERATMRQADQEARCVEECVRLREALEKSTQAWHHERGCLKAQHSEELFALQQEREALRHEIALLQAKCQEWQQTHDVDNDVAMQLIKRGLSQQMYSDLSVADREWLLQAATEADALQQKKGTSTQEPEAEISPTSFTG